MGSLENGFRFVAVSHADHPHPDNVMEAAVLWIDATEATTPATAERGEEDCQSTPTLGSQG